MENLMNYICDELEELDRKVGKDKKLSMTELQYADVLAHTKKNLIKADEMYEEGEYSMAGGQGGANRYFREGYSREGGRGGIYSREGGSYRGGSYARGRQSARRDSMGRYSNRGYSRAGDNEEYIEQLQEMMQELPPEAQQHVQKAIGKMEQM